MSLTTHIAGELSHAKSRGDHATAATLDEVLSALDVARVLLSCYCPAGDPPSAVPYAGTLSNSAIRDQWARLRALIDTHPYP